jgi:hypothetical protein
LNLNGFQDINTETLQRLTLAGPRFYDQHRLQRTTTSAFRHKDAATALNQQHGTLHESEAISNAHHSSRCLDQRCGDQTSSIQLAVRPCTRKRLDDNGTLTLFLVLGLSTPTTKPRCNKHRCSALVTVKSGHSMPPCLRLNEGGCRDCSFQLGAGLSFADKRLKQNNQVDAAAISTASQKATDVSLEQNEPRDELLILAPDGILSPPRRNGNLGEELKLVSPTL